MESRRDTHSTDTDALALASLSAGDQSGLKILFHKHYQTLYSVALRILGDTGQAEDIVQTVFIKLWEKRDKVDVSTSVSAYLRRMTINEALHLRRTSTRRAEIRGEMVLTTSHNISGENTTQANDIRTLANTAIERLPEKCREVFVLSRFEDMTYREIADALGISVKTVENQMGKALRMLRTALREYLSAFFF